MSLVMIVFFWISYVVTMILFFLMYKDIGFEPTVIIALSVILSVILSSILWDKKEVSDD